MTAAVTFYSLFSSDVEASVSAGSVVVTSCFVVVVEVVVCFVVVSFLVVVSFFVVVSFLVVVFKEGLMSLYSVQ